MRKQCMCTRLSLRDTQNMSGGEPGNEANCTCTTMRGCIKGAATHVNSINSRAVGVWDLEDVV